MNTLGEKKCWLYFLFLLLRDLAIFKLNCKPFAAGSLATVFITVVRIVFVKLDVGYNL